VAGPNTMVVRYRTRTADLIASDPGRRSLIRSARQKQFAEGKGGKVIESMEGGARTKKDGGDLKGAVVRERILYWDLMTRMRTRGAERKEGKTCVHCGGAGLWDSDEAVSPTQQEQVKKARGTTHDKMIEQGSFDNPTHHKKDKAKHKLHHKNNN